MSKKHAARKQKTGGPAEAGASAEVPAGNGPSWPADFASPRTCWIIGASLVAWTILIVLAGALDFFFVPRALLGWLGGLNDPRTVVAGTFDMGIVLCCGGVVLAAGAVHPGLGLATLVLFRPWLDGYTYPTDNFYFLWGVGFLAVLWSLRVFLRGEAIRFWTPVALLVGFLAVAILTSSGTIQVDRTFRQLLLWFAYFLFFFLACNSLRDRSALRIVLGGLMVVLAAQAVYAMLHFYYLLPYLRYELATDPSMRIRYFGIDAFTPELIRRFNINRAFGSMLFPNALAGFLVLLLPIAAVGFLDAWRRLRPAWALGLLPKEAPAKMLRRRYRAAGLALVAWLAATTVLFFCLEFRGALVIGPRPGYLGTYILALVATGGGLVAATAVFHLALRRGFIVCGMAVRAVGLTITLLLGGWTLWITYSRGAMLALAVAIAAGVLIYTVRRRWPAWLRAAAAVLLVTGLLAGLMAVAHTGTAIAEDNVPAAPAVQRADQELIKEGVQLTAKDLLNPASLGLRLTYWRVGLSIFADNVLSGVGQGNFGRAYPKYQYLGAGDVQEAHNFVLQTFCETGILGGAALLAFWIYVLFWGLRRVLREEDPWERLLLCSMLVGLLAFLGHAFIDISFSHPSLMMLAFTVTGLFFAWGSEGTEAAKASKGARLRGQLAALPILVITALVVGLSARVFVQDLGIGRAALVNVGDDGEINRRMQACRFLLLDAPYAVKAKKNGRSIYLSEALRLVPELERLQEIGPCYVRDSAGQARRLALGETPPPGSFLVVKNLAATRAAAVDGVVAWISELKRIDSRFPHNPQVAIDISRAYEMLARSTPKAEWDSQYRGWLQGYADWSGEAARRSPMRAGLQLRCAAAINLRLTRENRAMSIEERISWLRAMESHHLRAVQCFPTWPDFHRRYAKTLLRLSYCYTNLGDEERAAALKKRSDEANAEAEVLEARRIELGMPT